MLQPAPEPMPEPAHAGLPLSASSDPRQVLTRELPLIERIIGTMSRRNGLLGDDADDFASYVRAKLVFDDYAILRKFRGGSRLSTFLHAVVANLFHDFWIERWGKWRPSVAATRGGTWAVRLETLVVRDGTPWREAITIVRSCVGEVPTDREMFAFLSTLPPRVNSRKTARLDPDAVVSRADADADLERAEAEAHRDGMLAVLESCFSTLMAEDRLILRMKFWDRCQVSQIARTLSLDQKSLYRRIDAVLGRMEKELRAAGISAEHVRILLDDELPMDPRAGEDA